MGFKQNIIVSSPLELTERELIIQNFCNHWSFLRRPRQDDSFSDCLLLALPELTDSLFDDETSFEKVVEQNDGFVFELPNWSEIFPDVSFAFIRSDCFGGACLYDGFVCQAGAILYETNASKDGHILLLQYVDITTNEIFSPFKRGFFY